MSSILVSMSSGGRIVTLSPYPKHKFGSILDAIFEREQPRSVRLVAALRILAALQRKCKHILLSLQFDTPTAHTVASSKTKICRP